jgi:hypothetical protein
MSHCRISYINKGLQKYVSRELAIVVAIRIQQFWQNVEDWKKPLKKEQQQCWLEWMTGLVVGLEEFCDLWQSFNDVCRKASIQLKQERLNQ